MAYVDLNTIHNPAPNTVAPATWGDQVRENFEYLKNNVLEVLGQTTLGSAGDTITVSGLPERKWLRILIFTLASGNINSRLRFNNDSGANYAVRHADNGGADATSVSQTSIDLGTGGGGSRPEFIVIDVVNVAAQEKLVIGHTTTREAAGAANAPGRTEIVGKWANTASAITRVDVVNSQSGDFAIGSGVVVLGHN